MDARSNPGSELKTAGGHRAAGQIVRRVSAGLEAALEQFDDPELLTAGKVSIIALDAIVDRLGERWPVRRLQVHDHVAKTLERHLGLEGYFLRVSDTDYLISQPHLSRYAGQAASLRYLREILSHFLGESHLADHGVHEVNSISPTSLSAERVDARRVEVAEKKEAQEREAQSEASARTVDRWTPFTASDGRDLRVSCTLEPVFELKGFGRIGFRLSRRVLVVGTEEQLSPAAVSNLSRADILRIDLATIARGADRLRTAAGDKLQPSLIVPVSFTSLSSQTGRGQIVSVFKEAGELVSHGVICEVHDIEGVPQVALLSAVSLIRPFALFVVGYLHDTPPTAIAQLKGAGLQGISFACPPHQNEQEFLAWAKASIDPAKQVAKSVLAYRAPSARSAGLLGLLGATHASVQPG